MIRALIFIFLSMIYYGTFIANIYTAIQYYQLGYLAYFIIYLILVSIEKIAFLIYSIQNNISFWIFDLGLVGFIQMFYAPESKINQICNMKITLSIFPMIVLQTFLPIDQSEQTFTTLSTISYFNYIIQISLISLMSFKGSDVKFSFTQCFVTHLSYYLVFRHMYGSQDSFGISLGYYFLLFIIINIIVGFLLFPRKNMDYWIQIIVFNLSCIVQNFFLMTHLKRSRGSNIDYMTYISKWVGYLYQAIRLIIVLAFLKTEQYQNLFQIKNVYQLNLVLAILFITVYLIIYARRFYKLMVIKKYIIVREGKDLESATKLLQVKYRQDKIINVYLFLGQVEINCNNDQYERTYLLSRPLENCSYYLLQKSISFQMKQKANIRLCEWQCRVCYCGMNNLVKEEEYVNDRVLSRIDDQNISQVVFERLSKGFISTEVTKELISRKSYYLKDPIFKFRSHIIQQTAAIKIIYPLMVINPQQISYDLNIN